ncbi:PAS sensor-containing diguanylate cyclase (NMT1 domain) [Arcobacter acticola]|uniref:Thiamine pyrimidine synthase n=1 Tax=Arcobacter acticola TaxID=1849015 RepID=A0A6M8EIN9_9BACT|nr:GGDEF domain-containing protein [Arcobacter acticola]QKE29186.1 PAS sensor-containing diguanylate cyclase (NMT1 domain) [Arcobacter acticola]
MKKILLITFFLTIFLYAQNDKKITLQLNWLNQFQFAGYYMAKEKGFYKDVNLDVQIKESNFNTDVIKEIESKNADFAVGRSSLIIEKINGKDIVALCAIYQESPLILLVKKDSNINSVKDLRNKKIMITPDARYSAPVLAMLSANELTINDFMVQKHSFDINDLINRKTDAMASYISNEPILLNEKGIEYTIFNPKDFGFDLYSDILFSSSEYIKNNPKITKDFYEASLKGWKYAFENLAETAEIIYSKYNTQNKTFTHLVKEGEVLKKLAYTGNNELGDFNDNKLKNIANVFKLFGLVNKDLDLKEFIYKENKPKIINLEISKQEKNIIITILISLFLIFSLIIILLRKNSQTKKLLQTVINSSDDLIYYKDSKLRYIGCNKSFENLLAKKESEIIGKNDFELFEEDLAKVFRREDFEVLDENNLITSNEWIIFGHKRIFFQTKRIPFIYKNKKIGILGIARDITGLYEIQEKLKKQTYYDELTKIFNRKAYNERIQEKFDLFDRYDTNFTIAMYDIDDFKKINDTYGHDIGDKVLVEITNEVKSIIRKTDFLFRVGGEEFVIIFDKISLDESYDIAEKIRINVSKMQIIENEKITISMGITQAIANDNPQSIYERVDKLMYQSKRNNKNQTTKG